MEYPDQEKSRGILGLDIGSVAISAVLFDKNRHIQWSGYRFHSGRVKEAVINLLEQAGIEEVGAVAVTSSTPSSLQATAVYNVQLATIEGVRFFHNRDIGSILFVGGENFGLITFDESGGYERYRSNTSCAAGTGSFLDQQAKRLNLADSAELSRIAFANTAESPQIATRCAVFAKTDLIHAQQEGYSVGEISDGLCEGLAKNIVDTVRSEKGVREPLIFAGGVSMNQAVARHLRKLLDADPVKDNFSHLYGAVGAAVLYFEEYGVPRGSVAISACFSTRETAPEKVYGYEPLEIRFSSYPEFEVVQRYDFYASVSGIKVEVERFEERTGSCTVFLGIDIGSTSTKAVVLDTDRKVIAGYYTRTAGDPVKAIQGLFEAIADSMTQTGVELKVSGVATTGSGRKFIGKIIGADLVIDEITAHARAAYELDPEVDTILEIGGQDAKFTTLRNGMVTFSVMNNVCAAGTGSFIEEQALKLGCNISEYAARAMHARAPVASDRCTVFMERDLNYYLSEGYSVDEILASVLHSVRENYLSKVAVEANIGKKIFFQGATAKNKALVAAFEQKLQKPVLVSKFCHLTGALGAALILTEHGPRISLFRGIDIYRHSIPVKTEVCTQCRNNCKLRKITVKGDVISFGYLCGRDDDETPVPSARALPSMSSERERIFRIPADTANHDDSGKVTIGLPRSLYLFEDIPLWQYFFALLGVKTITSDKLHHPIRKGKKLTEAEFCAPMTAFHSHVHYLSQHADYLFLPVCLESRIKEKDTYRQFCYYTQFAPSLVVEACGVSAKAIMPVVDHRHFSTIRELYKTLRPVIKRSYWEIASAYERAQEFYSEGCGKLKIAAQKEISSRNDIKVVLLGRPYTVLDPEMNKAIPSYFGKMGIPVIYQDMLEYNENDIQGIQQLLKAIHWKYAAKILEVAKVVTEKDDLYPVYITSFKCGPDSFAIEYFKRIMEEKGKPYLILELDEHDSSVGYETRIEAAVRSFRNHFGQPSEKADNSSFSSLPSNPSVVTKIDGKTLLLPSWDNFTARLVEAVLIKEGVDARMVPLTQHTLRHGLRTNTGQCIPVNLIFQSCTDYIREHHLDPAHTLIWMFDSVLACNIRLYPYYIKSLLEAEGKGLEHVGVYVGDIALSDISWQASVDTYFAYLFAGMVRKMGCRIRPYEKNQGETDRVINEAGEILYRSLLGNRDREEDIERIVSQFMKIETIEMNRPKVALFGDMYVRDNELMNQQLIRAIEEAGGEVITTPFNEMVKMMLPVYLKRWAKLGFYKDIIQAKGVMLISSLLEKSYMKHFSAVLGEEKHDYAVAVDQALTPFHVTVSHSGESLDNLLKINVLLKHHPDISLFIQLNPGFCCAGLVTEAMGAQIEKVTGVPVVTLTYDGTGKYQNDKIIPYIKYPRTTK